MHFGRRCINASQLVDLSCNSVWVAEHNHSHLLYRTAYLATIADDMVRHTRRKNVLNDWVIVKIPIVVVGSH